MAALGGSTIAYRSFAVPPTGPVDPERAAARMAAFPLLAAALPEMVEITPLASQPPSNLAAAPNGQRPAQSPEAAHSDESAAGAAGENPRSIRDVPPASMHPAHAGEPPAWNAHSVRSPAAPAWGRDVEPVLAAGARHGAGYAPNGGWRPAPPPAREVAPARPARADLTIAQGSTRPAPAVGLTSLSGVFRTLNGTTQQPDRTDPRSGLQDLFGRL
ncbi:MAG: hypothetical protein J0H67_22340 [Rhodospirillales bacterium]|nr:hypothetical protein [Rhodospirillales bacterium]